MGFFVYVNFISYLYYVIKRETMKLYQLNFDYFCGVAWDNRERTITATSIPQLIRAFISETQFAHHATTRQLWDRHKKYIRTVTLTFPFVVDGDLTFE